MIYTGDSLEVLPTLAPKSVHCCVTSPPYFNLRSYSGGTAEIGIEATLDCVGWATGAKCGCCFVCRLCAVFGSKAENDGVWRVLRDDGTLFVNLGDSYSGSTMTGGNKSLIKSLNQSSKPDSYMMQRQFKGAKQEKSAGLKPKDLCMAPARFALAMQANGWYVRSDIIWSKPNPMPESVTDRPTKAHEYIFLLTKSEKYFYDADAIKEKSVSAGQTRRGGKKCSDRSQDNGLEPHNLHKYGETPPERNCRSVWEVATKSCKEAHFAVMPIALVTPCIRAGCPVGGTVLDPFAGSGTTGIVAMREGREFIGIELNADYAVMANRRVNGETPTLAELFAD